jgi:hypothetical protein
VTSPDALDSESEEVEPVIDRHNTGLLRGEPEAEWHEYLLDVSFQRFGVLLAARDADDEVIGLCRAACYAE